MKFRTIIAVCMLALVSACADDDTLDPDVDPREKFLGNWTVREETPGNPPQTYSSTVSRTSGDKEGVTISNIYNLGPSTSITAIVSGNSISLNTSQITGVSISGGGTFSGNGFVLNYSASDGGSPVQVKATYYR